MELTINQIKEKQKLLEEELQDKLNQFKKETGLKVRGRIVFQYDKLFPEPSPSTHIVFLEYSNPFMNGK
jgi:hypothetical protein